VEVRNEAKFTFKTQAGVPIPNVVVYMRDTNNGQRRLYNLCQQSIDNRPDKVYIQSSDITGVAQFMGTSNSILLCAVAHLVSNSDFTNNAGENIKDLHSKTNTEGVDDYTFYAWSYNYGLFPMDVILHSDTTPYAQSSTPIDDFYVTLTQAAATTKLASNFSVATTGSGTITVIASSSFDDLYDCMKAYKCIATKENMEFLGIKNQIVNASGSAADSGSVNIAGIEYFTAGSKFTAVKSTGTLTANGALKNGVSVIGNVTQATPTSLSGVTVTGNLAYNTNMPITVTFTNTTVTGTVSNSGTGAITINRINSTIGVAGSNITSRAPVTVNVTCLDASSNSAVSGVVVRIAASGSGPYADGTVVLSGTTDSAGKLITTSFNYIGDQAVTGMARKGTAAPYYKSQPVSGTVTSSGLALTIYLLKDQ